MASSPSQALGVTWGLAACALVAFAANSILCRQALGSKVLDSQSIDAATFTTIRLVSGAGMLLLLRRLQATRDERQPVSGSWWPTVALFSYAAFFSLAYRWLTAGMGALLLFGAVQATMIGGSFYRGERPGGRQWIGLGCALSGLVILVWPGLSAPSPVGCILMALAGVSWGGYSLLGRGVTQPLVATTTNFCRAVPLTLLFSFGSWLATGAAHYSLRAILLAIISGAITSGLGYVIWYRALRGLTSLQAATVQLAVPILSGMGGVLLMNEPFPSRLAIATPLVLGGIAWSMLSR